jgi:hypothetical protein
MKYLIGFKLTIALVAALALSFALSPANSKILAHEVEEEGSNQADVVYSYEAQAGDSYTKMARKAVQTYGLKEEINLSPASIIFAETNMTRAADSPELNLGQNIEIEESAIHEWVDKARELSDAAEAAWNEYVRFVDFNTDNVGESA